MPVVSLAVPNNGDREAPIPTLPDIGAEDKGLSCAELRKSIRKSSVLAVFGGSSFQESFSKSHEHWHASWLSTLHQLLHVCFEKELRFVVDQT